MGRDVRAPDAMRAATWESVEAMGIPPSRVRHVLFQLVAIMDNDPTGDELALASGAFRGMMNAFEEHYKPRTALEIQLETLRLSRELGEMGITPPDVHFSHADFELPPETPRELAAQLGYRDGGRAVRAVLRRGFRDHPKHARWDPLTEQQVNYVRAHIAPRVGSESSAKRTKAPHPTRR